MSEESDYLEMDFDTDTEESARLSLIPSGRYVASIEKATCGKTKNERGYQLKFDWVIGEGEYKGRHVFQNCLLEHENPEAAKLGRGRVKDICEALGKPGKLGDLRVLQDIPALIHVVIRSDKAGVYPDKNEIKDVASLKPDVSKSANAPIGKKGSGNGGMSDAIPF